MMAVIAQDGRLYKAYHLALRQAAIAGADSGQQMRGPRAAYTAIPEQEQRREANAGLGLQWCLIARAEADPDCQTG